MNGIKGLVFRELYLARKSIISVLGIFVVFMIMYVLIQMSMSFGNLAKLPAEEIENTRSGLYYLFLIIPSICVFVPMGAVTEIVSRDYASRWMPFQYSTPIKEEKYVLVKTLIASTVLAGGFLLAVLDAFIVSASSGRTLTFESFCIIPWIMAIASVIFTVATLLTARFRNLTTTLMICFVLFYVIFSFSSIDLIDKLSYVDTMEEMGQLVAEKCASTVPAAFIITILSMVLFQLILTSIFRKMKDTQAPVKKKNMKKKGEEKDAGSDI